jgi:hypothetical protein
LQVLGGPVKAQQLSFIPGKRVDWLNSTAAYDKREAYMEDTLMFKKPRGPVKKIWGEYPWPTPINYDDLMKNGTFKRPIPDSFEIYKSEFWVVLHK